MMVLLIGCMEILLRRTPTLFRAIVRTEFLLRLVKKAQPKIYTLAREECNKYEISSFSKKGEALH
jgi:hypothetical protein